MVITSCLFGGQMVFAQEANILEVADAVICQGISNREAVDSGTSFPASVAKLYCLTRIVGARTTTHITHVWYYGHQERFRISLPVKSTNWRTFSNKTIRPGDAGVWHVDILDASGNRLEVLNFNIEP
jgi:hypothetical protein